MQTFLT